MKGWIFDIQKFSIHDGPGIRTTVFLKGCPLRCAWCHNPESWTSGRVLSFLPEKCMGCGQCFKACQAHCHSLFEGIHQIDRSKCHLCGACARECYAQALTMIGREEEAEEIIRIVLRDKAFYDNSGGGMTLSGGEPFMQPDFSESLLRMAKEKGLHCCIETSGCCDFRHIDRMCSMVDLFLYDIKDTRDDIHRKHTGVSNQGIIANLRRLHDLGGNILLRLPLVPGLNDTLENFEGIAHLVRDLPRLSGVEIMPYHRLGASKLQRIGLGHLELSNPSADAAQVKKWVDELARLGVRVLNPAG